MKRAFISAGAVAGVMVCPPAGAHGYLKGHIEVRHPWTRATPPGAEIAAGYMVEIRNLGKAADRVIGASTPSGERVELEIQAGGSSKPHH